MLQTKCYICGSPPSIPLKYKKKIVGYRNGVDRVNSDLSYTRANSISCCWICNRGKGDLSLEEFIDHLRKAYLFWEYTTRNHKITVTDEGLMREDGFKIRAEIIDEHNIVVSTEDRDGNKKIGGHISIKYPEEK